MVRNPFPSLITQFLFNADPPHLSSRGRTIGYQVHTSNGYFTKISQQARPQRCGLTKHYPFTTPSLSPPLSLPLPKKTHLYCSTLIPFVPPPTHIHTISLSSNTQISGVIFFTYFSRSQVTTLSSTPPTHPSTHAPPTQPKTPHSTSSTLSAPKKMPFPLPSPPLPPQPTPRTLLTYLIHLLHLLTPPQELTPLLPLHRPSPRFPWFRTSPPRLHPPTALLARRIALRRARRA